MYFLKFLTLNLLCLCKFLSKQKGNRLQFIALTHSFFRYWLFFGKNMTENTSKRKLRIENKKKKMAALLDLAKLNEYDRAHKNKQSDKVDEGTVIKLEREPSPKRLKIIDNRYCIFTLLV